MVEPGLEFASEDFRRDLYAEVKGVLDAIYASHGKGAWKSKILINDRIADSIFQQVVTRANEYSVLACPNLNGDYISDACAAQVGGLGIAPAPISATSTPSSKPRTAPLRSTRTKTSSTPVR